MNRHYSPKFLGAAAALALALPMASNAVAGNKVYRALEGDRVLVITYDAKPPYSHRIVKVQDLSRDERARFEAMRAKAELDKADRQAARARKAAGAKDVLAVTDRKETEQAAN
jgi:hypothetical protein